MERADGGFTFIGMSELHAFGKYVATLTAVISVLSLGAYQLVPDATPAAAQAKPAPTVPTSPRIAAWLERKAIPMPQQESPPPVAPRAPVVAATERPQLVQRIVEPTPAPAPTRSQPRQRAKPSAEVSAARQMPEREQPPQAVAERRSASTPWMERLGD